MGGQQTYQLLGLVHAEVHVLHRLGQRIDHLRAARVHVRVVERLVLLLRRVQRQNVGRVLLLRLREVLRQLALHVLRRAVLVHEGGRVLRCVRVLVVSGHLHPRGGVPGVHARLHGGQQRAGDGEEPAHRRESV
jgi:hypothetical protein